jgi:hypothetical protein
LAIEFINGCHDAVLEFLLGCDADVPEHGAGELGKEQSLLSNQAAKLQAMSGKMNPHVIGFSVSTN